MRTIQLKALGLLVLGSVVGLTGCKETKLTDGKIPAGYEQYAREAEGVYSGDIDVAGVMGIRSGNRAMSLKISFENGRIVATPSADWLGAGCDSKIGKLQSVEVSGTKLKTAVFAFNGGKCANPNMDNRLVIRSFAQSTGRPKLVAWVTTNSGRASDQSSMSTVYSEARAHLRKN